MPAHLFFYLPSSPVLISIVKSGIELNLTGLAHRCIHAHACTHTHRNRKGYDATHLMCQSSHLSCFSKISLKMASVPSSFIVPRLQGDDKASSLVAWALCPISPRWHRRSLGMRKIMAVRDKGVFLHPVCRFFCTANCLYSVYVILLCMLQIERGL